jgi:hypothetical protein
MSVASDVLEKSEMDAHPVHLEDGHALTNEIVAYSF